MKKININIFRYFLLFIILPVTIIDIMNPKLYDIIKFVSIFIMSIIVTIEITKKKKIEKFDLLLIAHIMVLIISSIIQKTISLRSLFGIISIFVIPVFIHRSLNKSEHVLVGLYYLYVLIVILNFITIFFKINIGDQAYFFIGGKNAISLTIIPAMLIINVYSYMKHNELTLFNKILIGLCIISLIVSRSSTAFIIAMISICSYMNRFKSIKISRKKYFILYFVIFFIVVFGKTIVEDTFVDKMIKEVFNKDLTFSSRTDIWEVSCEGIKKSPIIGYGKNNGYIYNYSNNLFNQTHNMILQILLEGGIVTFSIFGLIIWKATKSVKKSNKISDIIIFYMFLYFILGLTESIAYNYQLWLIIAMSYVSDKIKINNKKENTIEKSME